MNIKYGDIEEAFVESIKKGDSKKVEEIYSCSDNKYILINMVKRYSLIDNLIDIAKNFVSLGHKKSLVNIATKY